MRHIGYRLAGLIIVVFAAAALAPSAMASVSSSLSLGQSAGTSAGGSHNLGLNLAFTDSGTDSPKDLTLQLPPGLLANADQDGGTCLKTAASSSPNAACSVGTATVVAQPDVEIPGGGLLGLGGTSLPAPVSVPVTFYLVAPPNSTDLAGLEVYTTYLGLDEQLGSTGDVLIRPSGSADGVGATIELTLPDTLTVDLPILGTVNAAPISITSISSTLDNLRYPTTCPSSPAPFRASVNSYADASAQSLSAPLSVTGCSSLSYSPQFTATATKDSGDDRVALTTNVTQTASQAPSKSIALSFPTATFAPGIGALGRLCLTSVSNCTPVGSVTAVSPLYPTALSGDAYLTGTSSGLTLTLTFPSPFPLTLVGTVNLLTNTASFTGLPDIPLTNLSVALLGGTHGLFATSCRTPSGTATAKLVDQSGDQQRSVSTSIKVSGCPSSSASGSGSSSGSGGSGGSSGSSGSGEPSSGGSGSSVTSSGTTASVDGTHLAADAVGGLSTGHPSMRFTVSVSRRTAKLERLTVMLPQGLSFRSRRDRTQLTVRGVSLSGAKIRTLRLSDHHLVISLRRDSRKVRVTLDSASLRETHALRREAEKQQLKRLRLKVATRNAQRRARTLTVTVRHFDLR